MKHALLLFFLTLLFTGCGRMVWFFDYTPPRVMEVHVDEGVTVTFSEEMSGPVTEEAFRMVIDDLPVEGDFTWTGTSMNFTPYIPFEENPVYRITLDTGAEDLHGNSLAEVYTTSPDRSSDTEPPRVIEYSPVLGECIHEPRPPVTITFSEPVVTEHFLPALRVSPVFAFSIEWNSGCDAVVLHPLEDLRKNTEYRISVGSECTDEASNGLRPECDFYFRTTREETPELTSVKALGSGLVLEGLETRETNQGIRHDDDFELNFSQAVQDMDIDSMVFFGPDTAATFREEGESKIILSPDTPLEYGKEYSLTILDKTYNLYCNNEESMPPAVTDIYVCTDGTAVTEMLLQHSITESSGTADFYVFLASYTGVTFSGVLDSFDIDITNACIELEILTVTENPTLPDGLREPGDTETVYRFSGTILDSPPPGIVSFSFDTGLVSGTGVHLPREAVFQISNL